jgi:hypothetical protein
MEPLNITITGLGLDTVVGAAYEGALTLADMIVAEAARNLAKDKDYQEVYGGLRNRVAMVRDDEIRARVKAEIDDAFGVPVVATNQWGEPTGKATTLRALILAEAEKFFTEKRGKDRYNNGPTMTGAERVVAALVAEELTKEMAAAFRVEKERVVAVVREKAAELIAAAVKEGLRK